MASIAFNQLMSRDTVTRMVSRIKTPQTRLQEYFKMLPGGQNVTQILGRDFSWDIFDRTRKIAKGRAPGVGPGTSSLQPVGRVAATCYRVHEKVMLSDEKIFPIRELGMDYSNVDERGQRYVAQQEQNLAQKFKNFREFLISRMLRGGFAVILDGDDIIPTDMTDGSANMVIDFKIPSGNTAQLNMLGGGDILDVSWADPAALVVQQFMKMNAAYEQLQGRPLSDVWMNSVTFSYLLNNTQLKNLGGTSNQIWDDFRRSEATPGDESPTGFVVRLRGIPWVWFHIYDAGIEINGTYTKYFPDGYMSACPTPDSTWCELIEGSELVRENDITAPTNQFGMVAWTQGKTQPGGRELIGLDNCCPAIYVPNCLVWAKPVF